MSREPEIGSLDLSETPCCIQLQGEGCPRHGPAVERPAPEGCAGCAALREQKDGAYNERGRRHQGGDAVTEHAIDWERLAKTLLRKYGGDRGAATVGDATLAAADTLNLTISRDSGCWCFSWDAPSLSYKPERS